MTLLVLLFLLFLIPTPGGAEVIFMSGFDTWDEEVDSNIDSFEFIQVADSDAEDLDMKLCTWTCAGGANQGYGCLDDTDCPSSTCTDTSCHFHGAAYNGTNSSRGVVSVNVTGGEQIYYEPHDGTQGSCNTGDVPACDEDADCAADCLIMDSENTFPLNALGEYITMHACVHGGADAVATADRTIIQIVEDGGQVGANVRWTTDEKFEIYYGNELLAAPGFTMEQYACETSGGNSYYHLPCDDDTDCPGDCSHDDATPELFFACLELTQNTRTTNEIEVRFHINGKRLYSSGIFTPAQSALHIDTVRFGAPADEASGTLHYWLDDLVICRGERCGWGFVGAMYPTSESNYDAWSKEGTNSGCAVTTQYECVDDWLDLDFNYVADPFYGGSGTEPRIQTSTRADITEFDDMTSDIDYAGGADVVEYIETLIVGRTPTTGGTREIVYGIKFDESVCAGGNKEGFECTVDSDCPGSTCATTTYPMFSPETVLRVNDDEDRILLRKISSHPAPGKSIFSPTNISNFEWHIESTADSNRQVMVGATVTYAFIRKPDAVNLPDVIQWGNYGTDDAYDTIMTIGDSTTVGTQGSECSPESDNRGERCVVGKYCSEWDNEEKDKVCDDNADCRTCDGIRIGIRGGLGYKCNMDDASDAEWEICERVCGDDSGADAKQACDSAADCNGGAGTCLTNLCDAVDSNGLCDNNSNVPCTDDSDCQGGLGTCDTTATCVESCPNGECPPPYSWPLAMAGRVKFDNLVNASIGAITTKTMDTLWNVLWQVGAGDPPDVIIVLGGINDSQGMPNTPNCTGLGAGISAPGTSGGSSCGIGGGCPCDPPTQEDCMADSECASGVHAQSVCVGRGIGTSRLCTTASSLTGASVVPCTVFRPRCSSDDDCGSWGGASCTVDESNYWGRGGCECTAGTCPSGYTCLKWCVGGTNDDEQCSVASDCPGGSCVDTKICHRNCTSDGDCWSSGGCNTTAGVCVGTCTKPSDDIDCSVGGDADCQTTWTNGEGLTFTYSGVCGIDDKCDCTGHATCYEDSTCTSQFNEGQYWTFKGHHMALDYFDSWQGDIDALNEVDDHPIVIFLTVPRANLRECESTYVNQQYRKRMNQHLLHDKHCNGGTDAGGNCEADSDCGGGTCERRFTYVVNIAATVGAEAVSECMAGWVHFNQYCSEVIGARVAEYLNAFNTCALDALTPDQRPQHFCRDADDTWTSTTCDLDTEFDDCSSTQTCQLKACTVDDETTANGCPGSSTCNLKTS